MVYSLEDLDVEFFSFGGVKWHAKRHECIGEPLDPNADETMTEVRSTCFVDGVVVYIDNTVEVIGDVFGDGLGFVEVIFAVFDVGRQSERGKVTYGCFVGRVLDNFGAEIGRFDGADILLVRFSCQIIISVASKTG